MEREKLIPRVALVLYVAYWIAVLFGYIRLDSADFSSGVFELLRAAAVVLPALALGYLVGRWTAVLAGLLFLVAVVLPGRTVVDGDGVDVTLLGIYDVSLKEALALIAVTTPCAVLGIVARRARRRPAGDEPPSEASAPESGRRAATGAPSGPS